MSKEINLIYGKRKNAVSRENKIKFFQYSAGISILFVAFCGILLFILNQTVALPVVLQQEQTAVQQLSFLQKRIGKLVLLHARLKNIDAIINSRLNLDQIVIDVTNGVPTDVAIDAFTINKKDVTLVLSSNSLASLDQCIAFLTDSIAKKKLFKKVTINSIAADIHIGKYSMSIDAEPL